MLIVSCHTYAPLQSDNKATNETKKKYSTLKKWSSEGTMIGYEDALAYGIGWKEDDGKCDMYRTSGQYPAIYGWDIGDIHKSTNLDTVSFGRMINWIKEIHQMGGINTISWHMDNPVTGESSWDISDIVKHIIPGGKHHSKLKEKLDKAAVFINNCKVGDQAIPIVFRPFHEHNGDWFWWGKGHTSEADYISLYRFVVDYFKTEHNIHHLIYAFSPDRSRISNVDDRQEYLYGYPGDDYVDLIGIDNYQDLKISDNDSIRQINIKNFVTSLEMVTDIAAEKGKLSALTETGVEGIKSDHWFMEQIYEPLMSSDKAQRISYILFWRNANTSHHFMTYPEHQGKDDFIKFVNDPKILTLKDIGRQPTKTTRGAITVK